MAPSLVGSVILGNLSLPICKLGLQYHLLMALLGGLKELNQRDPLFVRIRNYRHSSKEKFYNEDKFALKMPFVTEQGQRPLPCFA